MGKVRAISPEEQELKAKEAEKKEAERLARIEAAKAAGQRKKESEPKEIKEETKEDSGFKIQDSGKETEESPVILASDEGTRPESGSKEEKIDAGQASMTEETTEEAPKKAKKTSKYAAKQKSKTRISRA